MDINKGQWRFICVLSFLWVVYAVSFSDIKEIIISCFTSLSMQLMIIQAKE